MNKSKGILPGRSGNKADSESDDSIDFLTEQVKDLIECDGQQIQRNVLNGEIVPPKLRPSVVYRAFNKNITSTPLTAKGYIHFFASDSSLSPIVTKETTINSEKNVIDTEINHGKSIQNSKILISDGKCINSNNNVMPELSTNDCKKPQQISDKARITRSSLKNSSNLANNLLSNGTSSSESINKIKSTTPKRTSIITSIINDDSLPINKTYNLRNTSREKILVGYAPPSRKNIGNQAATIVNKALFNLPNDKTPLTKTLESRSSVKSLSPKSGRCKSNLIPDNGKGVSRGAGRSALPVRISTDTTSHVKSRKNIRQPLQVQNTDLGVSKEKEVEEKDDNKKRNSTGLNTESDKISNDNDRPVVFSMSPIPFPKARIEEDTEIVTNTEEINFFKPKQADEDANKTYGSDSSDAKDKQRRLAILIDSLINKEKTTLIPAPNESKTVLSRSVQTSYRKSSTSSSKHTNHLNKQEIQTQTSNKASEQNSSGGNVSYYTVLMEDCAQERNLFDSLKQPTLERFSSSYDEYGVLENSKRPWRVDENLNLPTRSSTFCLSFIKSASSIEEQQLDAMKEVKQYKEQRKSEKTVAKQIDSGESIIVNEILVNSVENEVAKSTEDDVESSVASFRPEIEVNTRKSPIESSLMAVEDQVIETAIEKRVSNYAVSEWVASVNNEFKNTDDDDSPCCFYEEDPINSVENTGRSKIAKALFQSDTGSDKGICSDVRIVLSKMDIPVKDVIHENNEAGTIIRSEQIKDVTTNDQMNKNEDKSEGVFKVPSKKAVRSVRSKKNQPSVVTPKNSVITPENSDEVSESDTTGVRKSRRSRRPTKRRNFSCVVLTRNTDEKCFLKMIRNVNMESCSTITSSSVRTLKKKSQTLEDKTPDENGNKNPKTPKNQLFSIPENSSCRNKSVVTGSNTRASKNKRKTVLAETPINVVEQDTFPDIYDNDHQADGVKEPKQLKIDNRSSRRQTGGSDVHTNVNTTTRKTSSKKSVFNEMETNEIVDTPYNDYEVNADKDPQQLEVTCNNREITHESYQYDKITNPSKCISSDSGRSTMIRSSIDDVNVRSVHISKAAVKKKTRRGRAPKNATTKVSDDADGVVAKAKDLNNVNGDDEKFIDGEPSVAGKLKYIEASPKLNQHLDNLKYSDTFNHCNGASMVYLEIPPGGSKKKHTNRKNNLFYCVIEGRGRVYIGDEESGIKKFSRFIIPTGLCYTIINDGMDENLIIACVKMPMS